MAFLWDQNRENEGAGQIPARYGFGREYSAEELTAALRGEDAAEQIGQTERRSGHGTAVAGVAAGNGEGSPGRRYRGIATESELLVVKVGRTSEDFAGTTEIMMGVDYIMRKALEFRRPVAINLSFGTNEGAHDGRSLFEDYLAQLNGVWKNVVVAASGNEGDARHHRSLLLENREEMVSFAVGPRERSLSMQIWKEYVDRFRVNLVTPSGREFTFPMAGQPAVYTYEDMMLQMYTGMPTPFTVRQEMYLAMLPAEENGVLEGGVWQLHFFPEEIVSGRVEMWLPTVEAIGLSTGFLEPDPDITLTIPSTSENIITVGAYRSDNDSVASFSGRGDTVDGRQMPTLVAPGVGVVTARPGGGYGPQTGTSIAAPFVTGSAALLMEWGIIQGNDPDLYGEKVKAYLIKGARKLPEQTRIPDTRAGWGALCLSSSFPEIGRY